MNPDRETRPARRFHGYCVGTSKSGTTSLAEMLSRRYRSAHEPEPIPLIEKILAVVDGTITSDQFTHYVRQRDDELWLEFESSQLLLYLIDILRDEFPNAKVILTLRDCYSWLASVTNHELTRRIKPAWRRMADHRFRSHEFKHSKHEQPLAERGLYTIDGYLSYWAEHNRAVLSRVPGHRLLVVKTNEILTKLDEIADFLGIPPDTIDVSGAHANRAAEWVDVLSKIDRRFIEEKVDLYCRDLMDEYFPGVRGSGAPKD